MQLYVSDLDVAAGAPRAALKGLRRVRLGAGETRTVDFGIDASMVTIVDGAGREVRPQGQFRLTIGGASPGGRAVSLGAPDGAEAVLTVR